MKAWYFLGYLKRFRYAKYTAHSHWFEVLVWSINVSKTWEGKWHIHIYDYFGRCTLHIGRTKCLSEVK